MKLERHGADLLGLCPFHDDHEPSLVITPSKNLWHCLGACQAGGSVIDWVMKAEGVSFRHAAELLRADLPPEGLSTGKPPEHSTVPKLPGLLDASEGDQVLLRRVVDYYHATLKESAEALAYLESRGLQHAEAVERFQLGFANRTLGYRLPAKNRQEGAAIRERLQALGVVRASGHEHLNGSLVVPVFDEEGRVAELYGRKITQGLRPGTPLRADGPLPSARPALGSARSPTAEPLHVRGEQAAPLHGPDGSRAHVSFPGAQHGRGERRSEPVVVPLPDRPAGARLRREHPEHAPGFRRCVAIARRPRRWRTRR